MADLFNRTPMTPGGAFTIDTGVIGGSGGISGILMQSIQVTYQRPVSRVFELGAAGKPNNIYYVQGQPQGNIQIARIVGFTAAVTAFLAEFGDACTIASHPEKHTLTLNLTPSQCDGPAGVAVPKVKLKMTGVLLTSVGYSVQAQNLVINENSAAEFVSMEYEV